MSEDRIVRRRPALVRLGISNSAAYRKVTSGLLTPPVKVGELASGWPESELDELVAAAVAELTEGETRALVRALMRRRGEIAKRMRLELSDKEAQPCAA